VGQTLPLPWQNLAAEVVASQSRKTIEMVANDRHYLMMAAYIEGADYINVYGTDITEFKKADDRLSFYANELERSNRDLEDFAYLASHDLQEPLRKIISFGDRLSHSLSSLDNAGREYLVRMQNAAERMKNFIDDLLEYSRLSKTQKHCELVDLNQIIQKVSVDWEERIDKCSGTLHSGVLPTLEGDPGQLSILFQNLISNSLKYHRSGIAPVISIASSYHEKTKTWEIEVKDNGIGIDEKYFKRIFKPFERLHGRSAYAGTGIGLAICEKIVHRHHGSIRVSSVPNQGSTFLVSIPAKQPMEN